MAEQILETKRKPRRSSVNGTRNVLTISGKEPGYTYRIVNDVGDRIEQLQDIGYELVKDDNIRVGDRRIANPTKEGSPVKVSVGGGIQAYVMRIKDQFVEEDNKAKAANYDRLEQGTVRDAKEGSDYGSLKVERG